MMECLICHHLFLETKIDSHVAWCNRNYRVIQESLKNAPKESTRIETEMEVEDEPEIHTEDEEEPERPSLMNEERKVSLMRQDSTQSTKTYEALPPPKVDPKYRREDVRPFPQGANSRTNSTTGPTYRCPQCNQIFPRSEIQSHTVHCTGRICRFCQEYYPEHLLEMHRDQCPRRFNPSSVSGIHSNIAQAENRNAAASTNRNTPENQGNAQQHPRPVIFIQDPFAQMFTLHLMNVPMPQPPQTGPFVTFFSRRTQPDSMGSFFDSFFNHRNFMQMNRGIFNSGRDLDDILQVLINSMPENQPRGLSREDLERIPEKKFKKSELKEGEQDQCTICLSNFEDNEDLRVLSCKHSYHKPCIDTWLVQNAHCPLCKKEMR